MGIVKFQLEVETCSNIAPNPKVDDLQSPFHHLDSFILQPLSDWITHCRFIWCDDTRSNESRMLIEQELSRNAASHTNRL